MTYAHYKAESSLSSSESVAEPNRWHLQDIYATEDLWQEDYTYLKKKLLEFEVYKGKLSTCPSIMLKCLKERDRIHLISDKLYGYSRMHRDSDTTNSHYQKLAAQAEFLMAQADDAMSFIEPEIVNLPPSIIKEFLQKERGFEDYQFYFENLIRQKEHILPHTKETLLSQFAEVTQVPENIYNTLTETDIAFPRTPGMHNTDIDLTENRYSLLIRSSNREIRKQAFLNLFKAYQQHRNTLAATLSGAIRSNIFFSQIRNYSSPLENSLSADNIPLLFYDTLIDTVHKNLAPLYRFSSLKKKWLQLSEFHMYDLYAPIATDVKETFSYEEGKNLVYRSLQPLGKEYTAVLSDAFRSRWVDVYEKKGKSSGAYSWGIYGTHPFILLNYNDSYDDVSTLAHEMGHALHTYYSHKKQPYINASSTTFCAEVASIVNELLLADYMLKNTTDSGFKTHLIYQRLELIRATVYRQTMFAEFEKKIYEKEQGNESLTADILDELWLKLNLLYYGPDVILDEEIAVEWARIPHFYWNFYVYQYVTGYAAATYLVKRLLEGNNDAQEKYITFLKSGSSDYSLRLLKNTGVDILQPDCIAITLREFSKLLDELENKLE